MQISQAGIAMIKRFEGCHLDAYPDPATGGAPWTIGYGHTRGVRPGDTITPEEAERLLLDDLALCSEAVRRLVQVALTQRQFDALVSFTYNVGVDSLAKSTLLKELNAGRYLAAADQFSRWVWANGTVMPGLRRRRQLERDVFCV